MKVTIFKAAKDNTHLSVVVDSWDYWLQWYELFYFESKNVLIRFQSGSLDVVHVDMNQLNNFCDCEWLDYT